MLQKFFSFIIAMLLSCTALSHTSYAQDSVSNKNSILAKALFDAAIQNMQLNEKTLAYEQLLFSYQLSPQATTAHCIAQILNEDKLEDAFLWKEKAALLAPYDREILIPYMLELFNQQKIPQAIERIKLYLQKDPKDRELSLTLAECYLSTHQYEDLEQHLLAIESLFSNNIYEQHLENLRLRFLQSLQASSEQFKKHAYYIYKTHIAKNINEALEGYRNLLQIHPTSEALLELEKQMTPEIRSHYLTRTLFIRYYVNTQNRKKVEKELKQILKDKKSQNDEAIQGILQALSMNAKIDPIYNPSLFLLLKKNPQNYDLHLFVLEMLFEQKSEKKIKKLIQKCLQRFPQKRQAIWEKSILREIREKNHKKALKQLARAKKKFPLYYRFPQLEAYVYAELKESQKAVQILQNALQLIPKEEKAGRGKIQASLALLLESNSDFDKARKIYQEALSSNSQDVLFLNNYASFLLKTMRGQEDLNLAEKLINKAMLLSKDEASILYTYACILFLKDKKSLSQLYFRKAIAFSKDENQRKIYQNKYNLLFPNSL